MKKSVIELVKLLEINPNIDLYKSTNIIKLLELVRQSSIFINGFYDCKQYETVQDCIIEQINYFLNENDNMPYEINRFIEKAKLIEWEI